MSPRIDAAVRAEGLRRERTLASPRFHDGRFRNTARVVPGIKGNPWPVLGEYFFADNNRVPSAPLPIVDPLAAWARAPETGLRATWLGHSTVLLEIDGARVSPIRCGATARRRCRSRARSAFTRAGLRSRSFPPLDAVLISHDHYDHLDRLHDARARAERRSDRHVARRRRASRGAGASRRSGSSSSTGGKSDAARAASGSPDHRDAVAALLRPRLRRSKSDALVVVLDPAAASRVFFSGDTGLTPENSGRSARRLGPFDLVMLEVGAYHPAWGDIHLGPENALRAHELLGGGTLLPVHWGTFNLALHAWDEPAETLVELAGQRGVRLVTPRLGESAEPARRNDARVVARHRTLVRARYPETELTGVGFGFGWGRRETVLTRRCRPS